MRDIRWFHWLILSGILAVGAFLRFHLITRVGLWPDEFWSSVHLATGRGTEIFELPTGVLISPPPQTLLSGAPPWWHIWTGLRGVIHPPLYFLLLRGWMELFGTADLATRSFSAIASLAGVVVLFDVVRRSANVHSGLLAAALMAIAPIQMNFSQETRPYPLLALLALLACDALLRIEKRGPSLPRLVQLGAAMAATALTHYFSAGALLAITLYATIRFRGPARTKTLLAIAIAGLFVLISWGPFFWQQRPEFSRQQAWSTQCPANPAMPFVRAAQIPAAYLYGIFGVPLGWIAPCVIAYLLPLLLFRRYPIALLWWLWIVGVLGVLVVYDLAQHACLLAFLKYESVGAVALYALCALPLPVRRWGWVLPYMILFSTAIATLQRLQEGPPETNGDWRGMALALDQRAGPDEPLIFHPDPFWGPPGMYYLDFAHYARNSHRPIMLLDGPADAHARAALMCYPRVWIMGPTGASAWKLLPDWQLLFVRGFPAAGSIAELRRPDAAASQTASPR